MFGNRARGYKNSLVASNGVLSVDGLTGVVDLSGSYMRGTRLAELSGSGTSFDFTSIPSGYRALMIHGKVRTNRASTLDQIKANVNNDTGANYYMQRVGGTGATASASETVGGTAANIASRAPGNTAPASHYGILDIWIPYYADTDFMKVIHARHFGASALTTGTFETGLFSFEWESTAAITRLTFASANSASIIGKMTLYGIG